MAAAGSEQKDLLALIHQHLAQIGYGKAARELLLQSGQKSFPSSPVLLRDIFTQWKKTSSQTQKQVPDDHKRDAVAKIRVPDPKSSSESEEEEVAKPIATNLSVNNRSTAKAESSSEDEDSSSEEEAVAEKTVKTPVAGNKTANFLQLAAQKSNSVPGKGVAVAAVQARGKPTKVVSSQQPLPAVAKTKQQNKVLSGKSGPLSPAGQSPAQAAAAKKASSSESSSSSSSVESEEEKTLTVSKSPAATQALKKAESSSEDSSDDSEEEATNTAATQIKPAVHSAQVNKTPTKSSLATGVASKVSPAQATVNQTRGGFGSPAGRAKPAESSETSDSSDSEDDKPASIQAKLLGKTPQALASPVKNAPSTLLSKKAVHTPAPLKQAAKPSGTDLKKPGLLSPTKTAGSAKETESSESSSSESEASPVPISQKRLQTPQPPTAAKQSLADKPGPPVKAASSALKGKDSESSSSSDSEDEMFPATANLPPPSATKRNATAVLSGAKKLQPSSASHQKAQESEDSSEDSSDESGSEEDTVFTQKPAQVAQKPGVVPAKTPAAKAAGAKAGNVQSAGKGATTPGKSAAASLQEEPESSETDSSDSSESEEEGKQAKQAPARSLFKQQTPSANAAIPSGKGLLTNSTVSDSVSSKCQGKGPAATPRKAEQQSPSKKAKLGQSQAQPAKHAGILKRKESSGSSSSSDTEAEAASTTAKGIARPGMLQKQGAIKEAESSSEESSDEEDQEPSQSLLTGYPGLLKTSTPAVPKSAASVLSKQTSRKAATVTPVMGAFAKSSEKAALCDSSSSDSSDSDTDAEKTPAVQKPEIGSLPSSGREAIVAKRAVGAKTAPGNIGSLASPAKKARRAQSNGKAKGTAAKHIEMPPSLLPVSHPEGVGSKSEEEVATQGSGAGTQGDMQATPCAATKAPKTPKSSKAGLKEKPLKKRKLAAGDAGVGEPKGKKLKVQSGLEVPKKKKKKKKSKCSSSIKSPKEKEGKEKKSKKKKSKKLESLASDASQKKKKKKKKTGDLEGAA